MAIDMQPSDKADAILVFARAPDIGRVKTRLQRHLPAETVLSLYRCMVTDVLDAAGDTGIPVTVCYYPADAGNRLRDWLGPAYTYLAQRGTTLGQRMKTAFEDTFAAGAARVVLIGTDIPTVDARYIRKALSALRTRPAVLGPTHDGGYCLVGFTAEGFLPAVFDDTMPWGTDRVLEKTRACLLTHHVGAQLLPAIPDIDDMAALKRLAATTAGTRNANATRAFLARLALDRHREDSDESNR